jgi:heme exporter protein CcmD
MTYAGYVAAAYGAAAIVLIGMIAYVLADLRAQKRKLARLEAEGFGRRGEAR